MIKAAIYLSLLAPLDPIYELIKEFPHVDFQVCTDRKDLEPLRDAEILIVDLCTSKMLEAAPRLKWIQSMFAGVDIYPLDIIEKRGIILTCGRGIATIHIAEYVICALIMLARNFPVFMKKQHERVWQRYVEQDEIYGATLGILGLGAIGKEIARKASLLGMKVIGVKRNYEETEFVDELYTPERMDEVFQKSDYIVNLLPYTPETERIINKRHFELMKPTASFINVGRGKTVDEADLVEALRTKRIKGMVSDVFYQEPLDAASPLWEMENVFITPHIAGTSRKYLVKSIDTLRHNLRAYTSGEGNLLNVVDWQKGY